MKAEEIIKELLICNDFNQTELAQVLEVSQKAISKWVNGKGNLSARNIIMIYEKFGITPNEFLGLEEPKNFKLLNKKGG